MAERVISLSADEALVVFDFLHRWEDSGDLLLRPGERTALWALSAALERVLAEPFDPQYAEMVEHARARLSAREGQ